MSGLSSPPSRPTSLPPPGARVRPEPSPTTTGAPNLLPGAEPFALPGGPVGCLLIHGFTSTPYDVRSCGNYLADHGIAAEGVLLAGHGTTPEDLARTRLPEWLDSIREAHGRLRARTPVVFALGISLAANFLVVLAQELSFAGLILVGMPLRFRHQHSYRALYYAYRAVGKRYQRKWYQQSLDPQIRRQRPNYDAIPLVCLRDAMTAVEWSRRALPAVRCPVLAMQSTTDHALDQQSLDTLATRLGTPDTEVKWVPNRYHVVLIDHGKEEIFRDILAFIKRHEPHL